MSKQWITMAFAVNITLLLLGCAQTPVVDDIAQISKEKAPVLVWQSDDFQPVDVPEIDHVFALTESQKRDFLRFYNDPIRAHIPAHHRLFNYLEQITNLFDYRGDTYIASKALELSTGNCLSLAILTSALAQEAGVEIEYRKVHAKPVYSRYDDLMTLSTHVQTRIYEPEDEKSDELVLARSSLIIDYFPSRYNDLGSLVSHPDFIAMFYQNLASEALIAKQYDLAYTLLSRAMENAPHNAETLNTLAVLYARVGKVEDAERIYQYAIDNAPTSLNLFSNYAKLLTQQKRFDDLTELEAKVDLSDDDNPYKWIDLANIAYGKSQYLKALRYFERAVKEAPYLNEGYFGQARSYVQLQQPEQAKHLLKRAIELANTDEQSLLYTAKLEVLGVNEATR